MAIFIGTNGADSILGTAENDTILGNDGNDTLNGGAGDDSIEGGAGSDQLTGGAGVNTLNGGSGNDFYLSVTLGTVIVETSTTDFDQLVAIGSYALTPGARVEFLVLSTAAGGGNYLIGNEYAQQLGGNDGDNLLDGGRNTAQPTLGDLLSGGNGNDTYVIRNPNDAIDQEFSGNDIVYVDAVSLQAAGQAVASYTLGAGLTIETLSAATQAGTEALILTGNNLTQTVVGNFGNNTLNGGSDGDDTLIGLDGDDTYVLGGLGNITIIDSAGTDTITFAAGVPPTFILNTGASVEVINMGAGVDQVFGNALNQRINGAAGSFAETLDGGGGADTLAGSGGDDQYRVDSVDDVIIETGFEANGVTATFDEVVYTATTGGYALAEGVNVDRLRTDAGGNVYLVGNSLVQELFGNAGNNILNGNGSGSGTARDTLIGGAGNDIYRVYTQTDVVDERVYTAPGVLGVPDTDAGGIDTVFTSSSYSLATTFGVVENLSVADQGGMTAGIVLTGNVASNQIVGNMAANTLNGGGGADTLIGLGGDDVYNLSGLETIVEAAGGGTDTINFVGAVLTTYTLTAGAEIEVINISGPVSNVTGNAFAQRINGTIGAQSLNGGGGADTLAGGAGGDDYFVDSVDDVIIETGLDADGVTATFDRLFFTGTTGGYALAEGVAIDSLNASGTTGDIFLIGNSGVQTIIGNAGNNILDGGGDTVAGLRDVLAGGAGDDIYRVYGLNEAIDEVAGQGNDTVYTSGNFNLGTNGANVENLIAADATALDNLVLQGNSGNNGISGNFGRNVLAGGAGVDTLTGLSGADTFHFADLGAGNADVIADFSAAQGDRISLSAATFTAFTGTTVTAAQFVLGVAATAAGPQILYDQATGRLFYDADGTGTDAAQIIATLVPGTALTNNDIVITPGTTVPTP